MATEKAETETENRQVANQEEVLRSVMEELLEWQRERAPQKKSANSQAVPSGSDGKPNQGPENVSTYKYSTLLYVLDYSEEPDELEACERELDRRLEAYEAWKDKNVPEEERERRRRAKEAQEPVRIITAPPDDVLLSYLTGVPYIVHNWGVLGESEC